MFHQVVKEFRTFQFRIADEPTAIHIVARPDHKANLTQWLQKLTSITDEVETELELSCIQFPRFYFLSRDKLIETQSYSRDCRNYFEAVRLCFGGINDLIYALPSNTEDKQQEEEHVQPIESDNKNVSQLELDINGIISFEN